MEMDSSLQPKGRGFPADREISARIGTERDVVSGIGLDNILGLGVGGKGRLARTECHFIFPKLAVWLGLHEIWILVHSF